MVIAMVARRVVMVLGIMISDNDGDAGDDDGDDDGNDGADADDDAPPSVYLCVYGRGWPCPQGKSTRW